MPGNPLLRLEELGQSVWLDFTERRMTQSGQLRGLIEDDGVRGVTSNPTIFEKAIDGSEDYDDEIRRLGRQGKNAAEIFETIAIEDLQAAADLFRPAFDREGGRDGFVSMEVSPHLAHDTEGTCAEARRFWRELARPNVMIKVPATDEGLPAIRTLTAEGINVNITLLFGLPRYRKVVDAYLSGLEERLAHGQPVDRLASVASFFLSRIDVLLDPQLEKMMAGGGVSARAAEETHGQVAIASAKAAYQIYQESFAGERWQRLAAAGAHPQRLLWASTGTKNPAYSDVKYVEPLIGPDTVNTMPLETLEAYRDHGRPGVTLTSDVAAAHSILGRLAGLGIDLDQATQQLEVEGEQKFNASYDKLMKALEKKRAAITA